MTMTVSAFRTFGDPMPERPPERKPMPRRRFVGIFLLPATLLAGGVGLGVYASLTNTSAPVPRPGPRRYPAPYRPGQPIPRE